MKVNASINAMIGKRWIKPNKNIAGHVTRNPHHINNANINLKDSKFNIYYNLSTGAEKGKSINNFQHLKAKLHQLDREQWLPKLKVRNQKYIKKHRKSQVKTLPQFLSSKPKQKRTEMVVVTLGHNDKQRIDAEIERKYSYLSHNRLHARLEEAYSEGFAGYILGYNQRNNFTKLLGGGTNVDENKYHKGAPHAHFDTYNKGHTANGTPSANFNTALSNEFHTSGKKALQIWHRRESKQLLTCVQNSLNQHFQKAHITLTYAPTHSKINSQTMKEYQKRQDKFNHLDRVAKRHLQYQYARLHHYAALKKDNQAKYKYYQRQKVSYSNINQKLKKQFSSGKSAISHASNSLKADQDKFAHTKKDFIKNVNTSADDRVTHYSHIASSATNSANKVTKNAARHATHSADIKIIKYNETADTSASLRVTDSSASASTSASNKIQDAVDSANTSANSVEGSYIASYVTNYDQIADSSATSSANDYITNYVSNYNKSVSSSNNALIASYSNTYSISAIDSANIRIDKSYDKVSTVASEDIQRATDSASDYIRDYVTSYNKIVSDSANIRIASYNNVYSGSASDFAITATKTANSSANQKVESAKNSYGTNQKLDQYNQELNAQNNSLVAEYRKYKKENEALNKQIQQSKAKLHQINVMAKDMSLKGMLKDIYHFADPNNTQENINMNVNNIVSCPDNGNISVVKNVMNMAIANLYQYAKSFFNRKQKRQQIQKQKQEQQEKLKAKKVKQAEIKAKQNKINQKKQGQQKQQEDQHVQPQNKGIKPHHPVKQLDSKGKIKLLKSLHIPTPKDHTFRDHTLHISANSFNSKRAPYRHNHLIPNKAQSSSAENQSEHKKRIMKYKRNQGWER